MNKSECIDVVAAKAELTKVAAGRAVDALLEAVTEALKEGDTVTFVGFGVFHVRTRSAREGRHPQTGAPMHISEAKVPAFRAGKGLKDSIR